MSVISPSDIAFEGFRLTREKPRAVLAWTALLFIVSLITLGLLLATGLREVMELAENGETDSTAAFAAMAKGGPAYLVLLAFGLLVQAVMMSAVFRAVMRPQESRFGYLRFGRDELRQMGLFLVLVAILVVSVFVIVLAGGIVATIVHSVLRAMGPVGTAIGVLAGAGIGIWVLGLVVFVVIRLSLAPPLTFASGRMRVFAAWRLSRGSFWRLLGAYALAFVMYMVVWILAMVVITGVGGVIGLMLGYSFSDVGSIFHPDLSSWAAYLTIPTLTYTLFSAALTAIQYAVLFSPSAVAYQALTREPDEGAEANLI